MTNKASPYLPYPEDSDLANKLVPIKEAAVHFDCSADTLKNNAKTRRFRAYQAGHGMPVFVVPGDVEKFLRTRGDIESVFQKRSSSKPRRQSASRSVPVQTERDPAVLTAHSAGVAGSPSIARLLNLAPDQLGLLADVLDLLSGQLRREAMSSQPVQQSLQLDANPSPNQEPC